MHDCPCGELDPGLSRGRVYSGLAREATGSRVACLRRLSFRSDWGARRGHSVRVLLGSPRRADLGTQRDVYHSFIREAMRGDSTYFATLHVEYGGAGSIFQNHRTNLLSA